MNSKQYRFKCTAILRDCEAQISEYLKLQEELEKLRAEKKKIDEQLMRCVEDSSSGYLIVDDKVLTIATDHTKHFRTTRFSQEHPDCYAKYLERKSVIVSEISEIKPEGGVSNEQHGEL